MKFSNKADRGNPEDVARQRDVGRCNAPIARRLIHGATPRVSVISTKPASTLNDTVPTYLYCGKGSDTLDGNGLWLADRIAGRIADRVGYRSGYDVWPIG